MSTTGRRFREGFSVVLIAALALWATPIPTARALGASGMPVPPTPAGLGAQRLELLWQRQLSIHDRMAEAFDNAGNRLAREQALIDRAKANGRDVTSVQGALDALAGAVQQSRPIFDSTSGIIASHPGFDASGKVIDPLLAAQTVRTLADKLRLARGPVADAMRALRAAISDARQTYRQLPMPSATPSA